MNFRKLLEDLPEEKVETITASDGNVYTFKGYEDAELRLSPFSIQKTDKEKICREWEGAIRVAFKRSVKVAPGLIWKVRLVAATIQVPEGEPAPQEAEIAAIATMRGGLFTELFMAAMKVVNMANDVDAIEASEKDAEGN